MAQIRDGPAAVGSGSCIWQTENLARGIYFVKAESPAGTLTQRVVLVR